MGYYGQKRPFAELQGKTLVRVHGGEGDSELRFVMSDDSEYKMFHQQDCCEYVFVESIDGDLSALCGHEVLMAEEVDGVTAAPLDKYEESYTWTFYKLATAGGYATIRWYGSSNGYYSEDVDFELVKEAQNDQD